MKYLLTLLFIVIVFLGFSQKNVNPKYYYGANHFLYKDSIKGKLGETQINIIKLTGNKATTITYHRFIYNKNDMIDLLAPIGKVFIEENNFDIENNKIKLPHHFYKYFIFNNEANDSILAYINENFLKNNIYDIYKEITVDEYNKLMKLQ